MGMPFARALGMRWTSVFLIVGIGCGGSGTSTAPADPPSMGSPAAAPDDMGVAPVAYAPQGGPWTPPPTEDPAVVHAQATPLAGAASLFAGVNVADVSTDQGGGVWAVSDTKVYYLPKGAAQPFT